MILLNKYFDQIWNQSKIKKVLPFPNAQPLYGSKGEGLANRKASLEHAKKVLDWNRKKLASNTLEVKEG
jgi:hypothetical protein